MGFGGGMPTQEQMAELAKQVPGGLPGGSALPPGMPGLPKGLPPNFPSLPGGGKFPGLPGLPSGKKK
jgi:signal recognition particle subunit SRP54